MTEGPGTIETRMFLEVTRSHEIKQLLESGQPMGRIGQPEEIAGL